jgi:hypothetical protein
VYFVTKRVDDAVRFRAPLHQDKLTFLWTSGQSDIMWYMHPTQARKAGTAIMTTHASCGHGHNPTNTLARAHNAPESQLHLFQRDPQQVWKFDAQTGPQRCTFLFQ